MIVKSIGNDPQWVRFVYICWYGSYWAGIDAVNLPRHLGASKLSKPDIYLAID